MTRNPMKKLVRILLPISFLVLSVTSLLAQDTVIEVKPFAGTAYSSGYLEKYNNYEMRTGNMPNVSKLNNRGFVTFDLTKLPAGAVIKSAIIKFNNGAGGTNGTAPAMGTLTGLPNSTVNGLITKDDIEKGPVYGDKLDWGPTLPPVVTSDFNAAGIEAMQKKIGSGFSIGINPPSSVNTARNLSGATLFITYQKSTASPKPTADFSAFNTAYKGDTILFTDNSGFYPTQWLWDFGDGTTSALQHPTHIYADTGKYTVKLKAWNASGSDSLTRANYMVITEKALPVADFVANTTETYVDIPISLYDSTSNNPISWKWYFGDGDSSINENPSHIYNEIGKYTVTLVAKNRYAPYAYPYSNIYASDTVIKYAYIDVRNPSLGPVANFGLADKNDKTLTFSDSSYNAPETWSWDFDAVNNPGVYTSQNTSPVFTYADYGTYKVCLTVSNSVGTDTSCMDITIENTTGLPGQIEDILSLYPNPAVNSIHIRVPGQGADYTAALYTVFGEKTDQQKTINNTGIITFDLTGLDNGIYFLKIRNRNTEHIKKFILIK